MKTVLIGLMRALLLLLSLNAIAHGDEGDNVIGQVNNM